MQVQTDPALDRGTAIFETSRGNLDASVEIQLREIEKGLTDRLERA
jgi:flagellar biosynthesis/type III secretory pathway protein FliH